MDAFQDEGSPAGSKLNSQDTDMEDPCTKYVYKEFPLSDHEQKRLIFATTSKRNLSEEVHLKNFVSWPDRLSDADVTAICQGTGMHDVKENSCIVLPKVFEKEHKNNFKKQVAEWMSNKDKYGKIFCQQEPWNFYLKKERLQLDCELD